MRAARRPASRAASRSGIARPLDDVRDLQRLSLGDRLAQARLSCRDVELAEPCNDLLVEPRGLAELEAPDLLAIVEYRATIGAGEIDRTVDNGLQHHLEIERRTHRAADLAQASSDERRVRVCAPAPPRTAACSRWR